MSLEITCPHCKQELEVSEELYGETVSCPACNKEMVLPNLKKKPVVAASKNINVNVDIKRKANPLGIGALVLGIIACLTCWIPIIGLLAIPMAAIGVILAIIGFIMAIVSKRTGFSFPVSGGIICVLAIIIAISTTNTAVVAVDNAMTASQKKRNATKQTVVENDGTPIQTPISTTPTLVKEKIQWASASQAVQQGDLRLKIKSVEVKRPKVQGTFDVKLANNNALVVEIELTNLSSGRKLNYKTWRDDSYTSGVAKLKDNFDNIYKRVGYGYTVTPIGGVVSESIYPSKTLNDVLIFEEPVKTIKWLHLELPCSFFGGEGFFRLEIPASMITF